MSASGSGSSFFDDDDDDDDDDYHGDALIQFISQTLQTTLFPRERESWLVVRITAELLSQTES